MFSEKTSEYDQLIEQIGTQLFSKYWNNNLDKFSDGKSLVIPMITKKI